jgi:DNA-binding NtrC family response regulator
MRVFRNAASSLLHGPADPEVESDERSSISLTRPKTANGTGVWLAADRTAFEARPSRSHLGTARQFGKLVARSRVMHELFDLLERFARTDVTVTLTGETGAGKDRIAHALHEESERAAGPMVVFDCGSVAANLAESEMLGHERGAFTGAVSAHAGAFERANGGTLFLDEVAELPLDLQPRLLRALESRCVRRVGGKVDRPVDVRVIAATHRDLRTEVAEGRFREDLFFRLVVAVVEVPALRNRLEELPELVYSLLRDLGRENLVVSEAALATLRAHSWPGNVRELKNTLTCAAAMLDPGVNVVRPQHLRLFRSADTVGEESTWMNGVPLAGHSLDCIERAAIRQTLRQAEGNKASAARMLGIAVSTLYEKLKKFGIEAHAGDR